MYDAVVDLAFGSRCACCRAPGRVLCRSCAERIPVAGFRVRPEPTPEDLAPAFVADWYVDPLRALVLAHKEHRAWGLARPLGSVLASVISAAVPEDREGALLVLVPVPSRPEVVRERGHDPVRRMVRAAARLLGAGARDGGPEVVARALLRQHGAVADQAGLNAEQRAVNLHGSLRVDARAQRLLARARRPVRFVVCDDVITTGATAREAQRALEGVGLPVTAVAALTATRRRRSARGGTEDG